MNDDHLRHVLTAAHCVMVRMKGMKIFFGSNDKYRLEKATVAKVHLHLKWSNKTLRSITRNDVAILT